MLDSCPTHGVLIKCLIHHTHAEKPLTMTPNGTSPRSRDDGLKAATPQLPFARAAAIRFFVCIIQDRQTESRKVLIYPSCQG